MARHCPLRPPPTLVFCLEAVMDLPQGEVRDGAGEIEAGEGDEMQASEDGQAALVVADEATEAGFPGEGALHDPTAGQQNEAVLGLGELDDVEVDAMSRGVRCGDGTRVRLVDE